MLADLGGAEQAVSTALALLYARDRRGRGAHAAVHLANGAEAFALPLRFGVTAEDSILGGGLAEYGVYRARTGWIAVAALEPHFRERLATLLELDDPSRAELEAVFSRRTAAQWQAWAREHDLPLVALAMD